MSSNGHKLLRLLIAAPSLGFFSILYLRVKLIALACVHTPRYEEQARLICSSDSPILRPFRIFRMALTLESFPTRI